MTAVRSFDTLVVQSVMELRVAFLWNETAHVPNRHQLSRRFWVLSIEIKENLGGIIEYYFRSTTILKYQALGGGDIMRNNLFIESK